VIAPIPEAERVEALKQEALAYQAEPEGQSPNELGMMNGLQPADIVGKPFLTEQLQWMQKIFKLHEDKVKDPLNEIPFSSIGNKPHSFTVIYNEKWGL
jgi:hypothetical protein